jgi:hypothetical protein
MAPLERADWLQVSEAYGAQMALRRRLIATRPAQVLARATTPVVQQAEAELVEMVLAHVAARGDFCVSETSVRGPDGTTTPRTRSAGLAMLGQIVQEDFCLMMPEEAGYVLRAACLCFPASWTLAEKLGKPLLGIHAPVESYTEDLAKRVQRLFDALHPARPMWRANALFYDDPALFHPRAEAAPRVAETRAPPYLRSERQSLIRLPRSGAVVFSIHTYLVHRAALTPAQSAAFTAHFAR